MKKNIRLVQKQVQKQKQKMTTTLRYVAVGVACTAIVSAVAFTYFNLGQSDSARAGNMAAPIKDPVKLRYFEAEKIEETIALKWRTLIEVENDHFTVERSEDGEMYEPIAVIQGAGFSESRKDYTFVDTDPLNGTNFYRLGKTNFEGQTVYSEPVKVLVEKAMPVKILSGGKNTAGLTEIVFESSGKMDVTVKLLDVTGREVYSKIIKPTAGRNKYTFEDKTQLANGIYAACIVQGNAKSNTLKVVKTN